MNNEITKKEKGAVHKTEYYDLSPSTDILEGKDGFKMYLDLPGVNSDSLKVDVEEGIMKITGTSILKHGEKLVRYSRSYQLSDEIDASAISATIQDGILELVLPKAEAAKIHRIEVKAG